MLTPGSIALVSGNVTIRGFAPQDAEGNLRL